MKKGDTMIDKSKLKKGVKIRNRKVMGDLVGKVTSFDDTFVTVSWIDPISARVNRSKGRRVIRWPITNINLELIG